MKLVILIYSCNSTTILGRPPTFQGNNKMWPSMPMPHPLKDRIQLPI